MNRSISHVDNYIRNAQHHETWQTLAVREDQNHDLQHGRVQHRHQQHYSSPTTNTCTDSILSSDLHAKLKGDVLVASGVTFGFAPFIAMIDKAIVQRAAGSHSILQSSGESLRSMVRNPVSFVKSPAFLMVWGVYAATYSTANCLKTYTEHQDMYDGDNESSRYQLDQNECNRGLNFGNFALTAAVNSSLQIAKDRYYASNFGRWNGTSKIPLRSYGLWALRDCTIIGSSFILPDIMCEVLQDKMDLDRTTALRISQFTCPIAAQVVAGPIQLLGLDFFNRTLCNLNYGDAAIERLKFQHCGFTSIVGARILKIVPAFSFCGIGNTYLRDLWRERLIRREEEVSSMDQNLVGVIGAMSNNNGMIS